MSKGCILLYVNHTIFKSDLIVKNAYSYKSCIIKTKEEVESIAPLAVSSSFPKGETLFSWMQDLQQIREEASNRTVETTFSQLHKQRMGKCQGKA